MNIDGIFKIALFPIPSSVTFPRTTVPLHVFEPRYRQMVQDCVKDQVLIGVCHTKSIERFAFKQQRKVESKEDLYATLKQNLTTYQPEDIFSAGTVQIDQETEDGRFMISVTMLKRVRLLDLIQAEPYKIGLCEDYRDREIINFEDAPAKVRERRQFILDLIKRELAYRDQPYEELCEELYNEKTVNDFTFLLFKFFRMQDFQMQEILNSQDSLDRLEKLYHFIVNLGKT